MEDKIKKALEEEELKEKKELLYQFYLMEQMGVMLRKHYTIEDDIDEMRFDYHVLNYEKEKKERAEQEKRLIEAKGRVAVGLVRLIGKVIVYAIKDHVPEELRKKIEKLDDIEKCTEEEIKELAQLLGDMIPKTNSPEQI